MKSKELDALTVARLQIIGEILAEEYISDIRNATPEDVELIFQLFVKDRNLTDENLNSRVRSHEKRLMPLKMFYVSTFKLGAVLKAKVFGK